MSNPVVKVTELPSNTSGTINSCKWIKQVEINVTTVHSRVSC